MVRVLPSVFLAFRTSEAIENDDENTSMYPDTSASYNSPTKNAQTHTHDTQWEDVSSEDSDSEEDLDSDDTSSDAIPDADHLSPEESEPSSDSDMSDPHDSSIADTNLPQPTPTVRSRGRSQAGRVRSRGQGRGRGRRQVASTSQSSIPPSSAVSIDTSESQAPDAPPFSPNRAAGPHLPPDTELSAIGLFELFFSDDIITRLVGATNSYADLKKLSKPSTYKRFCYHELTDGEMRRFVGVLLLLGITGVRSYRHAWSIKNAQYIVRLNEFMSRNRFEAISAFFHVVTPQEEIRNPQHPLKKILPLHEHLKQKCKELYQPLQQISIDERMVKSKARTKFQQYMKDKPAKWGYKYWVISDPSAYTYDFNLYLGAARSGRSEHGLAYDVVLALLETLHHQNYQLYCDNFYSSPFLFQHLLSLGVTATGTVRVNRRGVPQAVTQLKSTLQHRTTPRGKGYYIRERGSPIVYTCWNDNQVVCSMSTTHPGHSSGTVRRKCKNNSTSSCEVKDIPIPVMIAQYNRYMGGVDKSDQLLQYHSSLRRATRYWKTLFYHMLDVAVTNAFVLYNWGRMEREEKAISENNFRDAPILQIIERYRVQSTSHHCRPVSTTSLPAPHECRVRHGSTVSTRKERCCYCQQNGQKSWTSRHCLDCPFSPALCQTAKKDYHALCHSHEFDMQRSLWFSKRLARPSTPLLQAGGTRKRGRPAGATNKMKRRGFAKT